MKALPIPEKGKAPTLLHTELAAPLVERVNNLCNMTVAPDGIGKFEVTEGNAKLILHTLEFHEVVASGLLVTVRVAVEDGPTA